MAKETQTEVQQIEDQKTQTEKDQEFTPTETVMEIPAPIPKKGSEKKKKRSHSAGRPKTVEELSNLDDSLSPIVAIETPSKA